MTARFMGEPDLRWMTAARPTAELRRAARYRSRASVDFTSKFCSQSSIIFRLRSARARAAACSSRASSEMMIGTAASALAGGP